MSKLRSPAYPSISLDVAVQLVKRFHTQTNGHPVEATDEKPVAFRELGFDRPHGNAKRALAALISFKLVDNLSGACRRVQTSALGKNIATYPADDKDQTKWLQTAAVAPKAFSILLGQFSGGLPQSDSPIISSLMGDGFTRQAADAAAQVFRKTVAFAGLFDGTVVPAKYESQPEPKIVQAPRHELARPEASGGQVRSISIPVGPTKTVIVQCPAGMTKEDFNRFDLIWSNYKAWLTEDESGVQRLL